MSYIFFPFPKDVENPLKFEECRRHCCCLADPYILYYRALARLDNFRELYPEESSCETKEHARSLVKKAVPLLMMDQPAPYDPMEQIVIAYETSSTQPPNVCVEPGFSSYDNLEWCFDHKLNIEDCILGCYSGMADSDSLPEPRVHPRVHLRIHPWVHPHQHRPYFRFRAAFDFMTEIVEGDIHTRTFHSFSDSARTGVYDYIQSIKQEHPEETFGFGELCIYDSSTRLAWHGKGQRDELMPKKVWLHSGTLKGIEALWSIGKLTGHDYVATEGKRPPKGEDTNIAPESLSSQFQSLPGYHLENLLCIFHPVFFDWESELRIIKNYKLREKDHRPRRWFEEDKK